MKQLSSISDFRTQAHFIILNYLKDLVQIACLKFRNRVWYQNKACLLYIPKMIFFMRNYQTEFIIFLFTYFSSFKGCHNRVI